MGEGITNYQLPITDWERGVGGGGRGDCGGGVGGIWCWGGAWNWGGALGVDGITGEAWRPERWKKMRTGHPIVVLDPYEWMPGYGESGVETRSEGLDWIVEITYDDNTRTELLKRHLRFLAVSAFYAAAFPGRSVLDVEYGEDAPRDCLGSLLEFPNSEAAAAWTDYWRKSWPDTKRVIKHYSIQFLSENQTMEVFAEGFELTEPTIVSRHQ